MTELKKMSIAELLDYMCELCMDMDANAETQEWHGLDMALTEIKKEILNRVE